MRVPLTDSSLMPLIPPRWARGGHAQTIFGHLLPSPSLPKGGERVEIALADGDRLVGHLLASGDKGIVIGFHGLSGEATDDYMRRLALLSLRNGWASLLVNHRGCGKGHGLARRPYHSGSSPDLAAAIGAMRKRFPGKKIVAVGFSLSGNALGLLVGKYQELPQPDGAIVVNGPIDLLAASRLLGTGFNRVYDKRFVARCAKAVRRQFRAAGEPDPRLGSPTTLYAFDQRFTAAAAGFSSAEEYYEKCSAGPWLSHVKVPTFLLSAEDDPFVPAESYRSAVLSPAVRLHLEPHGGHMGYLSASPTPAGSRRWLDYALEVFLRSFD